MRPIPSNAIAYCSLLILLNFIGPSFALGANFQVNVNGNVISWGDQTAGYLQVQDAVNWTTRCEMQIHSRATHPLESREGNRCHVPSGVYNVINHWTRQRIHGIRIDGTNSVYIAPDSPLTGATTGSYAVINANDSRQRPQAISPSGLRASVYSDTALELFWDRQGSNKSYDIYRSGVWVATTRGTSYFDGAIPYKGLWSYSVRAQSYDGVTSQASTVLVDVPPLRDTATITMSNAQDILRQTVAIANRDFFHRANTALERGQQQIFDLLDQYQSDGTQALNGLTLIDGSIQGDSSHGSLGGVNGGQYSCDAGGSVQLPTVFSGSHQDGYQLTFNECRLPSGIYSGNQQAAPTGTGLLSHKRYTNIDVQSNGIQYRYTSEHRREQPYDDGALVIDTMNVPHFTEAFQGSGSVTRISRFQSTVRSYILATTNQRDAEATITFDAELPTLNGAVIHVDIRLSYDGHQYASTAIDQWNIGSINITASDRSTMIASVIEGDAEHIRIIVGDDIFDRPLSDGYQIRCLRDALIQCNS